MQFESRLLQLPTLWNRSFRLHVLALCLLAGSQAMSGQRLSCPNSNDEPMAVAGNAPVVTLDLSRLDGTKRAARFVFDSGGGAIIVDEPLADDLGLKPTGEAIEEGGVRFAPANPPVAQIGPVPVSLSASKAFIHLGKNSFDTRERTEGLLPGKALEPYQIVLDYPRKRFTIAPSGCLTHQGVKVPSPSLRASGHPRIEVSIDGRSYGLLLDTGSRVSLARRSLLESLSAAHPAWPHSTGASGTADMPGGSGDEFLLRVPEVTWGQFRIRNVLFVSRPDATYSPSSFETPGPIAGALGGNVLKSFRVEIDYPHGTSYLEQKASDAGEDMNTVGLVLDIDAANDLIVRAISSTAAALTKSNMRPGDQILEIDGRRETPWNLVDASDALSGAVGETKKLVIRRADKEIQTTARVAHLL
jgi:hypothetical protein